MLSKLFYAALAIVMFIALRHGRRFERRMALALGLAVLATGVLQQALHRSVPLAAFTLIDVALFALAFHTMIFDLRLWLVVFVMAQGCIVALDGAMALTWPISTLAYQNAVYTLGYVELTCIACAVVVCWLGPPRMPAG